MTMHKHATPDRCFLSPCVLSLQPVSSSFWKDYR